MNPVLKQLGFDANDRVAVVHADDIGMCQATLPAIEELFAFGLVTSAAVMTPCPWFPQAADLCRAHPEFDIGVHLTLNCEYQTYRWGAISTRDAASGMLDGQGYMHNWPSTTVQNADPKAVAAELRAQIDRALAAGIEPTHVDSHMGAVFHPPFALSYIEAALEYRLPPFLLSAEGTARLRATGFPASDALDDDVALHQMIDKHALPLFDELIMLPLQNPTDHVAIVKRVFDELRPGLTLIILHPAADTPELRAIASDWPSRVANYQAFLSADLREQVRQSGAQLIGYRPLRDALCAELDSR